ncbi:oligopeptide transporter 4-like isoform X2 [Durio zibethinus]|uniref:Oligopeptide transporter 4-like isoform X2 n=1 Tax=Durio zibethinus TaxID=66656 RepID=A0A6P5XHP0_DURZI|nr:oligopeptide transporter 4-like isoform X2 [Durio zibethinus]
MASLEVQATPNPTTLEPERHVINGASADDVDELSPIEEVRLTVSNTDDPTLPVWTFRMWFLGLLSCAFLSFLNQFFAYRKEPPIISQITVQVAILPSGQFMAAVLPRTKFKLPGSAFGGGSAYAVGIVTIIKVFYGRSISFLAGWLLIITTQVLGYGWAGLLRKYVVEPGHMWWPSTLVQVSLFRALHEKDDRRMTRAKFFFIVLICSFSWFVVPGYLFSTLTSISWVCWIFSKSVAAQQIGSGLRGLGLGALTLDWSAVASFLFSPLISPFFAIVNVFVGYVLTIYIAIPIAYWSLDFCNASRFPIFSSQLFTAQGKKYNIKAIVNDKFELDLAKYEEQGRINLSMLFALSYGFGFAAIASTLTHVALFYGREIYGRYRASYKGKEDIHTRLMKNYKGIPSWWFYILLAATFVVSLVLCIFLNDQVQMPWWGLLFASAMAFVFTLPVSIVTATTNQTPGLNVITEYVMGLIYPGRPIAIVCFKTYGYISMAQAVSFLNDFKLGHYMKIPPRSMFLVQFIGTVLAGTINIAVAWWLLNSIENICQDDLLPADSPWTCPDDQFFFDASVIWGLMGPKRTFGSLGNYGAMNWFFVGGALGPVIVWLLHKTFPKQSWIPLINLPVLLGATGMMPPATPLNYNAWIIVGTIFNFFIFRYRKQWWQRYNYILSAALDAGVAYMAILLYFSVGTGNSLTWWGTEGEHCELATCPTAKGIAVEGCPVN